ncbi:MAG TPA: hypothetical protein VG738_04385 [Chitinophagaceae bacterium]|nr:hypothetical protein [Chitinophagaceae bacterium]
MPVKWRIYYWSNWFLLTWSLLLGTWFLSRMPVLQKFFGKAFAITLVYSGASLLGIIKALYSISLIHRLKKSNCTATGWFTFTQIITIPLVFFLAAIIYTDVPLNFFILRRTINWFDIFELTGATLSLTAVIFTGINNFILPSTLQPADTNVDFIAAETYRVSRYNCLPVKWQIYYLGSLYLLIWAIIIAALIFWELSSQSIVEENYMQAILPAGLLLFFVIKAVSSINLTTHFKKALSITPRERFFFFAFFGLNILITGGLLYLFIANMPMHLPNYYIEYSSLLIYMSIMVTFFCSIWLCIFDIPFMKVVSGRLKNKI